MSHNVNMETVIWKRSEGVEDIGMGKWSNARRERGRKTEKQRERQKAGKRERYND